MSKFKVGDRVVMIGTGGPHDVLVATLNRLIPDGEAFAGQWQATCDDGLPAVFYEHQLKLICSAPPAADTTLTRRDRFAMAALSGLIANPHSNKDADVLARSAYQAADAMEAARNKEGAE